MKLLIVLALVALAVALPDGDYYNSKYNDFDVDGLISNARLLKAYTHCFIGDGKCTPEGNEIKSWIPDAVATSCSKCTDKQKALVAKTINAIKTQLPEDFDVLAKNVDPEKKYADNLTKFLAKYSA